MKKLIAILLLLCMLTALLSACAEKKPTDGTDTAVPGDSTGEPAETEARPNVPEGVKYDSYSFRILTCLGDYITFNDFKNENIDYDIVNEAIFRRNSEVEQLLDIVIETHEESGSVFSTGIGTTIMRQDFTAGESLYDLCGLSTWHAAAAAFNGHLTDLKSVPYLDLSQPWWDQRTNIDLGIGGKMYYTTGDIGITDNLATHCILFSKTLAKEKNITDLYDLVLDGKWTWDKFEGYVRTVSEDLDGNDVMNEYDRYGLLCWNDAFQASFGGTRSKIASVNQDTGALELTLYSDKTSGFAARITDLFFDGKYAFHCNSSVNSPKVTAAGGMISLFAKEQGLFFTTIFRILPDLRNEEMNFGILPYPKFDETQEEYGGYVSATYSHMYAVEHFNDELERTGVITEMLAYLASRYVTPAYYEQTLKGREVRDERDIPCLEIIFANRSFDPGVFYELGKYTGQLTSMMKAMVNKFEQIYKAYETSAQRKLDSLNEKFSQN